MVTAQFRKCVSIPTKIFCPLNEISLLVRGISNWFYLLFFYHNKDHHVCLCFCKHTVLIGNRFEMPNVSYTQPLQARLRILKHTTKMKEDFLPTHSYTHLQKRTRLTKTHFLQKSVTTLACNVVLN